MRTPWIVTAVALTSCWKSGTTVEPRQPKPGAVTAALASVTLGEDCHGGDVAQAELTQAPLADQAGDTACEQSALVLSVASPAAAKIAIKKVEVFDADHKSLGVLAARKPALWKDSAYMPWNEALVAGQTAQVSYDLPRFDWNKVPAGRYSPTALTVRVTLTVGSEETTVERQTELVSMPDPNVVT